jgi:hypothetical protein
MNVDIYNEGVGKCLYYDYNPFQDEYPTQHFV